MVFPSLKYTLKYTLKYNITGHTTTVENFSIVEREDQNLAKTVVHPSTRILANTICHLFGMRSCLIPRTQIYFSLM